MRTKARAVIVSVIAWLLLSPQFLSAQTAPAVPKRVVVRAGHMLEVKSGKMLADQAIVIEGEKVVSVGPASSAPSDATVVNPPNATVLPGLIDAHTHLTFDQGAVGYTGLGISVPREALIGAKNARLTLNAGFTTVRN